VLERQVFKMTNYPTGDYLIRIKNAAMAGRHEVSVPGTKMVKAIANVLKEMGLVNDITYDKKDNKLITTLKFHKKQPVLLNLKLVSKPGLRIYISRDELIKRRAASSLIISTSLGVMSSKQALKKGVGGEVLAEIW
jgi:small subunit ribosomal protein S8